MRRQAPAFPISAAVDVAAACDEAAARGVLLLQAVETGGDAAGHWSADDAAWASAQALATLPAGAGAGRFLALRAGHALARLGAREPALAPLLARRGWRAGWLALALTVGVLAGLAMDAAGHSQRINLLTPPLLAVVGWNLLVYAALLLAWPVQAWPARDRPRPGMRRWLTRNLAGTGTGTGIGSAPSPFEGRLEAALEARLEARFQAAWLRAAAPLLAARAALLLHAAAFALALGLVTGLYLRGLVLDYRVGWQSTFLDAAQVHAVLAALFAPAAAVTGLAVPDVAVLQALRFAGDGSGAAAALPLTSAARWIHLWAATLAGAVLLPRALLAAHAGWRAAGLARHFALPLAEPYFQRLLRGWRAGGARGVQVLPCAAAPGAPALAGLQALLAASLGAGLQCGVTAPLPLADGPVTVPAAPAGTGWRVLLVDLAGTPEAHLHGALVRALQAATPRLPVLLVADEAGFVSRFGHLPARLAERRALWGRFAAAMAVDFESAALG